MDTEVCQEPKAQRLTMAGNNRNETDVTAAPPPVKTVDSASILPHLADNVQQCDDGNEA